MSISNALEDYILGLIFFGNPIPGLADNAASSPLTTLYLALHTADPGDAGNQSTSEVTYTPYTRKALPRSSASWTTAQGQLNLAAIQSFVQGTAGSGSAAFWSIGTAQTGTGMILWSGAVAPAIATGNGVTPQLGTGTYVALD